MLLNCDLKQKQDAVLEQDSKCPRIGKKGEGPIARHFEFWLALQLAVSIAASLAISSISLHKTGLGFWSWGVSISSRLERATYSKMLYCQILGLTGVDTGSRTWPNSEFSFSDALSMLYKLPLLARPKLWLFCPVKLQTTTAKTRVIALSRSRWAPYKVHMSNAVQHSGLCRAYPEADEP